VPRARIQQQMMLKMRMKEIEVDQPLFKSTYINTGFALLSSQGLSTILFTMTSAATDLHLMNMNRMAELLAEGSELRNISGNRLIYKLVVARR
jgi:hypothetical protein